MGRPTDGGNANNPPALPDDAPYVPRVFAFDPGIAAELIDSSDEAAGEDAASEARAEGGDGARADASQAPAAALPPAIEPTASTSSASAPATDADAAAPQPAQPPIEPEPPQLAPEPEPLDAAVAGTEPSEPQPTVAEPVAETADAGAEPAEVAMPAAPEPVAASGPSEPAADHVTFDGPAPEQPSVGGPPEAEVAAEQPASDDFDQTVWAPDRAAADHIPFASAEPLPPAASTPEQWTAEAAPPDAGVAAEAAAPTAEIPVALAEPESALPETAGYASTPQETAGYEPAAAAGPEPTQVLPVESEPIAPERTSVLPSSYAAVPEASALPVAEPWSRPAPDPAATQIVAPPSATAPESSAVFPGGGPSGSGGGPGGPSGRDSNDSKEGGSTPRRGKKKALIWSGAAVIVLAGLYVGAQWYFSDKVARNTTVAGIDIGGQTKEEATKALNSKLASRMAEPIVVTAGTGSEEGKASIDPKKSGLTFDAAATVEPLTSFSLSPTVLWDHLTGGDEVVPVVTVDSKALNAQVASLKETLDVDPVDGGVEFVDGQPKATKAADGVGVDESKVREALVSNWLVSTKPVALPTKTTSPAITQAKTDAALAVAKKVVSGPVVVSVAGQNAELPPQVLAEAAAFKAKDGELALTFDGEALTDAVVDRTHNLLTKAADAHFEFVNGRPKAVGGGKGTTLDHAKLTSGVATASQAAAGSRTVKMELTESDPEQSVQKLEKLGVKEKISEFSTPLTSEPVRTKNLIRGASKVNGTLVLPGETFSLTETLSPITIAGGYYSAGIISDGMHIDGVGGGLSQMSTTTYNAAYFAGVTLVEHRPHTYWFKRYPPGRESTLAVGSLDMKFKNDTPYGLLLQASVSGGQVHVAIWSTKYYDVKTSDSGKSGFTSPGRVTRSGPKCVPSGAGQPGFSITNYRKVYLNGKLVKDEKYPWTYRPDNATSCE